MFQEPVAYQEGIVVMNERLDYVNPVYKDMASTFNDPAPYSPGYDQEKRPVPSGYNQDKKPEFGFPSLTTK